jgi:CTP:molybdopterin cytidylyltransferase MocA
MSLPPPFDANLKVLVLAGSDPPPAAAGSGRDGRERPLHDKAFLPLRGRLVLEYVLDLLQESGLSRVWLLAAAANLARVPDRYRFIPVPQPIGAHFLASVGAAARALDSQPGEPILVVFGDHPLTSPAALQVFLAGCAAQLDDADFFHGLALQAAYREYSAWFRRTAFHTREMSGRASGLSLVIPSRLHHLSALEELYGVRKLEHLSSLAGLLWRLARWLGPDAPRGLIDAVIVYLVKELEKAGRGSGRGAALAGRLDAWVTARIRLRRLERYAKRVLGADRGVRLVPVAHGGMAIDVDYPEELEALERHWETITAITRRQDDCLLAATAAPMRPLR